MDYPSVLDFLYNQLANYQKSGGTAYKPGLDNINRLLKEIGNPHQSIKTIHLAGTNGKGSTSHILASILIENGYKVGLFTSPHIKDFRERIKINGQLISEQEVVDFINQFKPIFDKLQPSFFEITTALAFYTFKKHQCDISIIETGLGGRLDSTNVIQPEVSIITNIGLDHTTFLGDTIPEIAREKAGIIKTKTPIIIGEHTPETLSVFEQVAQNKQAPLTLVKDSTNYETDLLGEFQQKNIRTALTAIQQLKQKGWFIDDQKSTLALEKVGRNTNFIGRLQKINNSPLTLIDASHNPDGIKNLFKELKHLDYKNLHCIYASSSDKDVKGIFNYFPQHGNYYFTQFETNRQFSIGELEKLGTEHQLHFSTFTDPKEALQAAKQHYKSGDLIIIFGSFFLLEKFI